MAKIHKTMRGRTINMETLRLQNEKEIALGNMNVNAGGDEIGPGGVIIKTRSERIRDANAIHTMVPGKVPVSKTRDEVIRKTAEQQAAQQEVAEAEKILDVADENKDESIPQGGLAAELAAAQTKT